MQETRLLLLFERPNRAPEVVTALPDAPREPVTLHHRSGSLDLRIELAPRDNGMRLTAEAALLSGADAGFFSLLYRANAETPWNYEGPVAASEVYRQSPHEVDAWVLNDLALQSVPMIATQAKGAFFVALTNTPALYDNFTSQFYDIPKRELTLSAGDRGETPGMKPSQKTLDDIPQQENAKKVQAFRLPQVCAHYPAIAPGNPHRFEALVFRTPGSTLPDLRRAVCARIAHAWSDGTFQDRFGEVVFASTWMNLRRNETGRSHTWLVPSVEYSNRQYCRDAFWMATVLPEAYSLEALRHELAAPEHFAECTLLLLPWAFRHWKTPHTPNPEDLRPVLNLIERQTREGCFHAFDYSGRDIRQDYQYWADQIAFEKDDVIAFNQGLLAAALQCAQAMGIPTQTDPALARRRYIELFNHELGFFPVSRIKKQILTPEAVTGDLLSWLLHGQPLLPRELVEQHVRKVLAVAKTPFGYKNVCMPDGSYPPSDLYNAAGYTAAANLGTNPDGYYVRGGSWFLYDNLMLLDAIMHGLDVEDELIWRILLDFRIGGTTFETIGTQTGEPWKPNMGWNAAIYAFWKQMRAAGNVSGRLLEELPRQLE